MKANGKFLLEKKIVFVIENSDGKMLYFPFSIENLSPTAVESMWKCVQDYRTSDLNGFEAAKKLSVSNYSHILGVTLDLLFQ